MTTQVLREKTTVAIVGGGVAGLTLASLLRKVGVDCVIVERRPRTYVEQRQRAGVVEFRGVRMFQEWGLGAVLGKFPSKWTNEIRIDGESVFMGKDPVTQGSVGALTAQQMLVSNLIEAFLGDGGDLRFEVADVALHGIDGEDQAFVSYTEADGVAHEIECDIIAGADGYHGISRASIPDGVLTAYTRDFGISWLAIMADATPPPNPSFAAGEHGYAAAFRRGPESTRFYLEVPPADSVEDWPESRIWPELRLRFGWPDLAAGPVTETEIFPLRSEVFEPMSYGRLYLLGDAAHVISPMGAKGMNLALADAEALAVAVGVYIREGNEAELRAYSDTALKRVWLYQDYGNWLSELLFPLCGERAKADPYGARIARARLARVTDPQSLAARAWGELITGLA